MTQTPETREVRIKRLTMRSMRRGIKEMDLILMDYAARHLSDLSDADLVTYDHLLSENDHDIFAWILGKAPVPPEYSALVAVITKGAAGVTRPGRV